MRWKILGRKKKTIGLLTSCLFFIFLTVFSCPASPEASEEIEVKTMTTISAPSAVHVAAVATNANNVEVSWEAVEGAEFYTLYDAID